MVYAGAMSMNASPSSAVDVAAAEILQTGKYETVTFALG